MTERMTNDDHAKSAQRQLQNSPVYLCVDNLKTARRERWLLTSTNERDKTRAKEHFHNANTAVVCNQIASCRQSSASYGPRLIHHGLHLE